MVTLIAPSGQVTPAGVVPRLKQMTVVGTLTRATTNTTRRW
jgi:ABC-type lipoprotein release transport system permease subunit